MSSSDPGGVGRAITLDQLIALNDEMAALVRAGVPLERGLIQASRDMSGRSGLLAGSVGERLERGERLEDVLSRSGLRFPRLYQAIVEAGLRSGQLARALEGLATIARGYAEARKSIGMALLYPLLVVLLAYTLFLFFAVQVAPRFAAAVESLGLPPIRVLSFLADASRTVAYWGPIVPALLVLMLIQWTMMARSTVLDGGLLGRLAGWMPLVRPMLNDFRAANFADLLALLVEHGTPLDEGVRIAGEASGHRWFQQASARLADRLRRGDSSPPPPGGGRRGFPPLLGWILGAGQRQGRLGPALRELAANYRRKATARAEFLQAVLPMILTVTIGGGCVIVYALVLFLPLSSFWDELAAPISR